MRPTLIALHGYTMNGAALREQLGPLVPALEAHVDVLTPDAPLACSRASIERLSAVWGRAPGPGPHLTWWDATDDGSVYGGFEETRAELAALVDAHQPAAILGFSQGAIMATALAGLSVGRERLGADARRRARAEPQQDPTKTTFEPEFPSLAFVILVAGRVPRALDLQPLFVETIPLPSLHIWGERDTMTVDQGQVLLERFAAPERVVWPGGHKVPTGGEPAARIVDFVGRHVPDRHLG